MQLSGNFWLHEFARSETAARMGREVEIPAPMISNLRLLVSHVLQPLRAHLGAPIAILSGYRPPWLNIAVGGSLSSEHMDGRAADFIVAGCGNAEVCRVIEGLALPFNQLILEFPPNGWVHVSVPKAGIPPDRQVLTAVKRAGRTTYLRGIQPA
jgi:hypothetical protein